MKKTKIKDAFCPACGGQQYRHTDKGNEYVQCERSHRNLVSVDAATVKSWYDIRPSEAPKKRGCTEIQIGDDEQVDRWYVLRGGKLDYQVELHSVKQRKDGTWTKTYEKRYHGNIRSVMMTLLTEHINMRDISTLKDLLNVYQATLEELEDLGKHIYTIDTDTDAE